MPSPSVADDIDVDDNVHAYDVHADDVHADDDDLYDNSVNK